jgi:hypothetical protein
VLSDTSIVKFRPKQCSAHPFYSVIVVRKRFLTLYTRGPSMYNCEGWISHIASSCAPNFDALTAVCTPRIAKKIGVLRIAKVGRLNLRAICHRSETSAYNHWLLLSLRAEQALAIRSIFES